MNTKNYIKRLGEIELERAVLIDELDRVQDQLSLLDQEYYALRNILLSKIPDRRQIGQGRLLVEAIYQILKEAGTPLHYKAILSHLREQMFHIAGSAVESNIIVHLNRDNRFMKVGRGVYGLSEWESVKNSSTSLVQLRHHKQPKRREGNIQSLLSMERERELLKYTLETLKVDINITQNNLKELRDTLISGNNDYPQLEGLNLNMAIPALESRLTKLLKQRDEMGKNLQNIENVIRSREVSESTEPLK